jgi:hypothetical protein
LFTIVEKDAAEGLSKLPRAERRRGLKGTARAARYARPTKAKHGSFVDRAQPLPFTPAERHKPFTPSELTQRAVARRDQKRALVNLMLKTGRTDATLVLDNRAPHANRGTPERRHFDRSKTRETAQLQCQAGVQRNALGRTADGKHDLVARYGHSSRAGRRQEAPLAMAA